MFSKAKAAVDHANKDGSTALMAASQNGHIECVRALIGAKATVDHANKDGSTALMVASQTGHDG